MADPDLGGPADTDPESLTIATSDESGVLRHVGCLLPGTWTLEPVTTPAGYEERGATVVLDSPWDAEAEAWDRIAETTVELRLVPDTTGTPTSTPPAPPTGTTAPDGGTDPTTPTTPQAPPSTQPTAPPAPAGPGGGSAPGGSGTGGVVAARPAAGSSAAAAAPTSAASPAPTTAAAPAATSTAARPTSARSETAVSQGVEAAPALESRSSTSYLQAGLIGFGVLFTGLVFFLVLLLRRRAREQRG